MLPAAGVRLAPVAPAAPVAPVVPAGRALDPAAPSVDAAFLLAGCEPFPAAPVVDANSPVAHEPAPFALAGHAISPAALSKPVAASAVHAAFHFAPAVHERALFAPAVDSAFPSRFFYRLRFADRHQNSQAIAGDQAPHPNEDAAIGLRGQLEDSRPNGFRLAVWLERLRAVICWNWIDPSPFQSAQGH